MSGRSCRVGGRLWPPNGLKNRFCWFAIRRSTISVEVPNRRLPNESCTSISAPENPGRRARPRPR